VETLGEALGHLRSGKSMGKVAVVLDKQAPVSVAIRPREHFDLAGAKSYLISGGLGGIGQMVARWLVEQGARNLILLSRSGPTGHDAANFLQELEDDGVVVKTPACDVSDAEALQALLEQYLVEMPPIRGCIQASMVLADSLFDNMPFLSWVSSTAPKTNGSWNLHTLLPSDLEFFVSFSSLCGTFGQVGQANYAAGNTFQDALARYRTSLGHRNSYALDLGIVSGIGYLARNEEIAERLLLSGQFLTITPDHLRSLLENCISKKRQPSSPTKIVLEESQILVGLQTPHAKQQRTPLFKHLHLYQDTSRKPITFEAPELVGLKSRFLAAAPLEAALVVAHSLRTKVAHLLSTSAASLTNHDIDIFQPLLNYGVDSLLGVELRNWLAREFAADIPIFEIMGGASAIGIGSSIVKLSKLKGDS